MTQPRQDDPQFKLRVPALLHAEIMRSAAANNRSKNAEIVARLEASGESLRDRFAGQALPSLIASLAIGAHETVEDAAQNCATAAYTFADALLVERSKGGTA